MKGRKRNGSRLAGVSLLVGSAFLMLLMVLNTVEQPRIDAYQSLGRSVSVIQPYPGLPQEHLFNSGDAKALDAIPGVGEVLSERIVQWREINRPYMFPEDIMLVKGIGQKRFEDAMAYIEQLEATQSDLQEE